MKVLVVDDSPTIRKILKNILRKHGIEVEEASGGNEGLQKLLKDKEIKLIISDLNMPEMSGIEFIKRARETKPSIRVAILSTEEEKHLVKDVEVDAYFVKPPNIPEFIKKVKELLLSAEKAS